MAKFGIALGSGPRGLGFESRHSDIDALKFDGFRAFLFICHMENRTGVRDIQCGFLIFCGIF